MNLRARSALCIVLWLGLAGCLTLGCSAPPPRAPPPGAEVRVLSAVGMRQVMRHLEPKFERTTGHSLQLSFDSGGVILERIEGGEPADVVMVNRTDMERLASAGRLSSATAVIDLAKSRVGVAVRQGTPRPDISTPAAFRRAMLEARTIACPDPALGGSSGLHIAKVFDQLGIAEAVQPKLVLVSTPQQARTMPGHVVADGGAEIALHQMQELMAVPGIVVVGPLPDELQQTFVFSAAVMAGAKDASAATAFIEFLRTPEARAVITATGMEPADAMPDHRP